MILHEEHLSSLEHGKDTLRHGILILTLLQIKDDRVEKDTSLSSTVLTFTLETFPPLPQTSSSIFPSSVYRFATLQIQDTYIPRLPNEILTSFLLPNRETLDSRDFYFISLIIGQRNLAYLVAARSCGSSSFCGRRNYASSDSPALTLMTLSRGQRPFLSASTPVLALLLSSSQGVCTGIIIIIISDVTR